MSSGHDADAFYLEILPGAAALGPLGLGPFSWAATILGLWRIQYVYLCTHCLRPLPSSHCFLDSSSGRKGAIGADLDSGVYAEVELAPRSFCSPDCLRAHLMTAVDKLEFKVRRGGSGDATRISVS